MWTAISRVLMFVVLLFPGRVDPPLRRRAAPRTTCPLAGTRTRVHQAGPHRARLRRADPARAATTVSSEQAHEMR